MTGTFTAKRDAPDQSDITLRPLETRDECEACVTLQRDIWGQDFLDVVPATILMVSQRVGGVAAGAFDVNKTLLGFVFGISGVREGRLAHWSDMLAVRLEVRRAGLGRLLKLYQRDRLMELGVEVADWSFDPLVAVNANLNINGLGAIPVDYVVNMYGDTGSTLHRGLETDRLIVRWTLADPRVATIIERGSAALAADATAAPIVTPDVATVDPRRLPDDAWVRIAIPPAIATLKATNPNDARRWQLAVRRAFQRYLSDGYRVVGFIPGSDTESASYVLTRQAEQA